MSYEQLPGQYPCRATERTFFLKVFEHCKSMQKVYLIFKSLIFSKPPIDSRQLLSRQKNF